MGGSWSVIDYCKVGDNVGLKKCIKSNPDIDLDIRDNKQMTGLMHLSMCVPAHTSEYAHRNCVWNLIKGGANLELKNKDGYTALELAIINGVSIAALLLINATPVDKLTLPMYYACLYNRKEVIRDLIEIGVPLYHTTKNLVDAYNTVYNDSKTKKAK